jgi:hypothetical protein
MNDKEPGADAVRGTVPLSEYGVEPLSAKEEAATRRQIIDNGYLPGGKAFIQKCETLILRSLATLDASRADNLATQEELLRVEAEAAELRRCFEEFIEDGDIMMAGAILTSTTAGQDLLAKLERVEAEAGVLRDAAELGLEQARAHRDGTGGNGRTAKDIVVIHEALTGTTAGTDLLAEIQALRAKVANWQPLIDAVDAAYQANLEVMGGYTRGVSLALWYKALDIYREIAGLPGEPGDLGTKKEGAG